MARSLVIAVAALSFTPAAQANSTSASFAAGGLVFTREPRVSIAEEELTIEPRRVTVRYLFRNNSNQDVTTEVAFPLPDYRLSPSGVPPEYAGFSVEVDGRQVPFNTETRAFVGDVEYTNALTDHGMKVAYAGSGDGFGACARDVQALPEKVRSDLVARHVVSKEGLPLWTVRVRYHWRQRFPPHGTVSITHAYTPTAGGSFYSSAPPGDALRAEMQCRDAELDEWLKAKRHWGGVTVRYILTTGANWGGPIGRFTLNVEGGDAQLAFLCLDGAKRIAPNRFHFEATPYRPTKDLAVHFVQSEVRAAGE